MIWKLDRAAVAAYALAILAITSGCAVAPSHPAIARAAEEGALPPLIPVRRFVANVEYAGGYALAPDGRQLLWSTVVGTDSGLAVRDLAGDQARTFPTGFLSRSAGPAYAWLPDSRHVMYLKDLRGDENTQLLVFDSRAAFEPWVVTPWPGVRSYFIGNGPRGTSKFLFASNRRDRATMDVYEADAATRTVREVARSDGQVLWWLVGTDNELALRGRQLGAADGSDVAVEVRDPQGQWKLLRVVPAWASFWMHRVDRAAGKAWGLSGVGRDKTALVEVDLVTGEEKMLASHPAVDLSQAYYRRSEGGPVAYLSEAGHPVLHYLDDAVAADVERAVGQAVQDGAIPEMPRFTRPQSASEDGRLWIFRASSDTEDAELLFDRTTGKATRLDPPEPQRRAILSSAQPYSFVTSDGRTVHGYVIRPPGVKGPAPMVVRIHGGPWVRERWMPAGFDTDQLLANRGYAVLSVNYRGSSGYGREFMMAGAQVYFTRLQRDVAEAAQWAVDQGLADPSRMAVMGMSFGGFSVLAQLIHRWHDWRCGVNIVGVADWARVIENWPPFWRNRHMFHAFFGDPSIPQERARMLENSPLSHLAKITAPLLVIHGANDVRVLRQDSDDVVSGLRKLGRPVEYLSFDNEGHSVRRWRNRLEMWRRIEDHLAGCLGGRSAGWDFYELMPR